MPTYVYRCKACSYEFEEFQKIKDDPLVLCPSCKRETLARIIAGGAGLVFKGSGFYQTDYKNPPKESIRTSHGDKNKSSKDSEKKSPASSESKPESKPETKADSKPAEKKNSE